MNCEPRLGTVCNFLFVFFRPFTPNKTFVTDSFTDRSFSYHAIAFSGVCCFYLQNSDKHERLELTPQEKFLYFHTIWKIVCKTDKETSPVCNLATLNSYYFVKGCQNY